jgi:hypothetical protein
VVIPIHLAGDIRRGGNRCASLLVNRAAVLRAPIRQPGADKAAGAVQGRAGLVW